MKPKKCESGRSAGFIRLRQLTDGGVRYFILFNKSFFILFFVRKEKYTKETLSCDKNREIPTHLMEFSMERFTSSLWSILCLGVSLEFLAILIARSPAGASLEIWHVWCDTFTCLHERERVK